MVKAILDQYGIYVTIVERKARTSVGKPAFDLNIYADTQKFLELTKPCIKGIPP